MTDARPKLIGFNATKRQHRRLFEVAEANGTTATELLREALARVLAEYDEEEKQTANA